MTGVQTCALPILEDKIIRLMKKAINRGGTDNISIAYLERFSKTREEGVQE